MSEQLSTQCAIAGGGPAGMMLGFLLARAGVDVIVLEKHADFLRDFRGDTIHPSTLEVMHELGIADELLKIPHQEVQQLGARFGDKEVTVADFSGVSTRSKFIALMPQWDFLDFIARRAQRCPSFNLRMSTEVTALIEEGGDVVGVRANSGATALEVRAPLTVGCDGRSSVVRDRAGLKVVELGAPMDVLWFSVSRVPGDPSNIMGTFDAGHIFIAINRGEHWQLGLVIPKGGQEQVQREGLERFRAMIAALAPFLANRLGEIASWDQVKLLSVRVDRLTQWYRRGLLCIGDAAHAMSPIGGVGINLAVQDAVAAARILAVPLSSGRATEKHLQLLQERREWPTRLTQRMQVFLQKRVITKALEAKPGGPGQRRSRPPAVIRLLARMPILRRLIGRIVGLGFRPEHVAI
jgi:2-polyprenyl-6-methoxyphenol hydroxylase-like FAD-dependent oxidoreductase